MENTNNNILEIKNLHTYFYTDSGVIKSVDGVDIELREGSTLGIVGESGSGKSVTALSVMGLLMGTTGKVAEGEILFEGRDLTKLDDEERRKMRGEKISMIFQEPMTSLNPVMKIGDQITECILRQGCGDAEADGRSQGGAHDEGISLPAFRRTAPESHDSHGPGVQTEDPHSGRAYHGTGRYHPGPDSGSDGEPEAENRNLHPVHHP